LSGETVRQKTVNRPAAVTPAAAVPVKVPVQVQTFSNKVSSPKDPSEKEAEATAKKVMRMAQPPSIARFAGSIQRKGEGQPNVPGNVAADIQSSMAGGSPLPAGVRGFMEPRFRADFSRVKVHTGEKAARLSAGLNAQAFTVGNHVFFGRDRFRPESPQGRELIAHELTHTIQQGSVIQRSEDVSVAQSSPVQVQRLGVSDALNYFADKANLIPGFRMFTIVLGVNPINMSRVDRSAANILRAVVEFIPGGALITRALDNYGVFDRVGNWVEQQIRTLGMTGASIRQAVMSFIDSLSWTDIFDLGGVWDRAKRIFSEPIDRILSFLAGLGAGILRFIREAILRPLAALAARTPAWDLLKAVLGQDPITGDPYPRNADTLIGGFMKLIGQEEVWNNLKRANAVARAWAWFQSALSELIGFVREIPTVFLQALQALQIEDLVDLPGAFARVGRVFSNFVGRFTSWGLAKVLNLLEIIFEVLAPAVVPYLRKAAGAFRTIIQNPIGFIGNLVRAGLQGFRQFAANFLTHLRTSLISWLTGTLSGANIYIPQAFTLREIIKFVLSVLGLTWQNIRQKLVRVVGETAVRAMETGFDIVMTLVTQGPAAAWEKIQESLSNLRDMVMEQIMTFVRDRVVQAAITRLLTSLNPAGAFIQAIIAIYNTIMFFVERLRQIAQVAASFIDSISAIASGVISAAAGRVEQTMAGLLTLVISFLARIAGLGRVSDAVVSIVERVRAPIGRAFDRVVDWIVAQARRLGRFVAQAGVPQDPNERLRLGMQAAVAAVNRFAGRRVGAAILNPLLSAIRVRYGFQSLTVVPQEGRWLVDGEVNPRRRNPTDARTESGPGAFPYRISGVGRLMAGNLAESSGGGLTPAPAQKHRRAYIGNTPLTLAGSPSAIAQRYLTAFSSPEEAQGRFSLVLGVNAFDDLANANRAAVQAKAASGAGAAYPWAIFGFLWMPRWVDSGGGPVATMDSVRTAYQNPQLSVQDRAAAVAHERASLTQAQIPYGPIRTRIMQSGATSGFNGALRARADDVFIHVSDPDTVNFNPQGEGSGTQEALFQRFDRILDGIIGNVQQHQGQGQHPSDGGPPIIATGGYEFQFQLDPSQRVAGETTDLRVQLAAHLDMAVRRAMASVDPRSVYFPEPNLLVQVTDQTVRASFGLGRYEARRLIEDVESRGLRPRLVFNLQASLATAADRFTVEGARIISNWTQLRELTEGDLRAMVNNSQSHARQFVWARQISASYGLPAQTALEPLNRLWEVFFPISPLLCGFDPELLRRGREFTGNPSYGNVSSIRENLLRSVARQPQGSAVSSDPTSVATTDRIIGVARAGGLALADALAEMFHRAGASR